MLDGQQYKGQTNYLLFPRSTSDFEKDPLGKAGSHKENRPREKYKRKVARTER
jgi:hypothetical protein